jgi:hypothetical protein
MVIFHRFLYVYQRVSTQFPIPFIWGVGSNRDFGMPPGLICVGSVSSSFLMEVAHLDFSSPAPWPKPLGEWCCSDLIVISW